jgi:hypothetical protein
VKLPHLLLPLFRCAAEKFDHSRSSFTVSSIEALFCFSFITRERELRKKQKTFNFVKTQEIQHQMARVRSTARITREEEETEATETAPISEVMRRSGMVVTEGGSDEGAPATEAEQADIEEGDICEEEIDYNTAMPSKPSHLDFGKSTMSEADMPMLTKLGYFGEAEKKLIRFGGEETIPKPESDEVVVFKSFFKAGLRFPLHRIIVDVLENFEIYLHQLTPNAIVRLSVFIWALRSQGAEPLAEAFCRVHELHYQTKAREDGLHDNFGCYNFVYRKDMKAPVISYRTKWLTGWKTEWFYVKIDEKKEKLVQSPLELTFGLTSPQCNITPGAPYAQMLWVNLELYLHILVLEI